MRISNDGLLNFYGNIQFSLVFFSRTIYARVKKEEKTFTVVDLYMKKIHDKKRLMHQEIYDVSFKN